MSKPFTSKRLQKLADEISKFAQYAHQASYSGKEINTNTIGPTIRQIMLAKVQIDKFAHDRNEDKIRRKFGHSYKTPTISNYDEEFQFHQT